MTLFKDVLNFMLQACPHQPKDEQIMWLLHRATGVGIFLFLALHTVHISLMGLGSEPFNTLTRIFTQPIGPVLHVFLFFSVLFHAINGLRLILLDFWPVLQYHQRTSINIATILFLAIFIPSALLILMDGFLP
jgi:succinate dehydrogenase / fumarate reductase cytochrome b subunit